MLSYITQKAWYLDLLRFESFPENHEMRSCLILLFFQEIHLRSSTFPQKTCHNCHITYAYVISRFHHVSWSDFIWNIRTLMIRRTVPSWFETVWSDSEVILIWQASLWSKAPFSARSCSLALSSLTSSPPPTPSSPFSSWIRGRRTGQARTWMWLSSQLSLWEGMDEGWILLWPLLNLLHLQSLSSVTSVHWGNFWSLDSLRTVDKFHPIMISPFVQVSEKWAVASCWVFSYLTIKVVSKLKILFQFYFVRNTTKHCLLQGSEKRWGTPPCALAHCLHARHH